MYYDVCVWYSYIVFMYQGNVYVYVINTIKPLTMLSNKDFAYILSGKSEASDEGKTRFGLDQIRQWDKQNKLKGKTKHTNKQQKKRDSEGEGASVKTSEESGYRDRAQERRKDVNPDYGHMEGLNELDVEQTKYLGMYIRTCIRWGDMIIRIV